jgi:hypothetical protein
MADALLLDEWHLSFLAAGGRPDAEHLAACRALGRRRFRARVRAAVRRLLDRHPALRRVRVQLSR